MRMKDPVDGICQVVGINYPDPMATSQNYRMECVVTAPGIDPTATTHRGMCSTAKWPSPGDELPVTVDRAEPSHFVVHWDQLQTGRQQAMSQAQALAGQMRSGTDSSVATDQLPPVKDRVSAADVLARGTRGNATLLGTFPAPESAGDSEHTLIGLMLNVLLDGHQPFQAQNYYKAPNTKLAALTPGTLLPVAVALPDQTMVAVDWDAV
ncbi:MAG: hypothetical protein ABSC56_03480 [Solirubrobacteraceae bacterium]